MSIDPAVQAYWDQQQRLMTENIRRHGVHLTFVSSGGPCACCGDDVEEEVPDLVAEMLGGPEGLPPRLDVPFCYTTGLYGVGHAELIVVGLAPVPSAVLLNEVARRVFEDGQDLVPGQLLEVDGLKVLAEELPEPWMTTFETFHYYDRPPRVPLETYQLTWADPQGRFPWDEGHVPVPWPQPRPGEYRA